MKAISLGLISSIIFNVVLAQKFLGSEAFMDCFSFFKKKPKKKHNIDEPVKVKVKDKGVYDPDLPDLKFIDELDPIILEDHEWHQTELDEPFISETNGTIVDKMPGFLRRENESRRKGWYIRPYEEEYEDMIKDMFMPLKTNYQPIQSNQENEHKQKCTTIAIPNPPEKQKFNTIIEEYLNAQCNDEESDGNVATFKFMLPECGVIVQGVWAEDLGLEIQDLCDEASVELSIS
ncbi:erythrocyte membrane antigen 1 [Plasmodium chabaudi chabaudi]|uniref:Erythrocyte membrane antigen 1 n=1 Tax=Plasmodium chabaudi chabaudi TaxID=31271 RepID=A0A077XF90_PLACU|nr:erythrocyte membrane antigen 1 [Plasmodium chabaudi chabaudi]SCL88945.1 erythrocyte membrane antigen 1 [Plasmodium chabaudi chabaudi]VTZ68988.1 erythrocyte membrane antigen 1 [Plasmodium chabaudi chabaudi]|eukprot:XP_016655460.1 erythrocyte membrane antigen 1 [Plasmodium chabaudi chabaudi]